MVSLAVLLGLCFIIALGCVRGVHAFQRAHHTALLADAERDGVCYHYPTRRCGRAVDVYHPASTLIKAT